MGGAFLALAGRDAIVIGSDQRFNLPGSHILLGKHPRKIYRVGKQTLIGCYGLDGDASTLFQLLRKKLHENSITNRQASAEVVSSAISNILYDNQLFAVPIIAGFSQSGKPYLCSMDSLGSKSESPSFLALGTAAASISTNCERLYGPDMTPDELVAVAKTCMRTALHRDAVSGCGLRIVTLLKNGTIYEVTEDDYVV